MSKLLKAIEILHQRRVVDVKTNRGAYVANPGPDEAREIFEARRVIERSLVCMAAERCSRQDHKKLQTIINAEIKASEQSNRSELVSQSGKFHLELASSR